MKNKYDGVGAVEENQAGCVYFIRREDTQLIKIGCTKLPVSQRLANLSHQYKVPLTLLYTIPSYNPRGAEYATHLVFKACRVHGEWFNITLSDIQEWAAADYGIRLQRFRQARNFSLRELARIIHVPYSTLSKLENGHRLPMWETVCKLADALHVLTDEFRKEPSVEKQKVARNTEAK